MASSDEPATALADIVGHIYEAAFDAERWQDVMRLVSRRVQATAGAVYLHDFAAAATGGAAMNGSLAAVQGLPESAVMSYASHYGALNPWARNEEALQAGRAVSSSMLYPDHLLPKTEFYGDWLRHHDLFYSLGGIVDRSEDLALKFTFLRPLECGPYEAHELALWQSLFPHVQRAAGMHLRLARQQQRAADAEAALAALAGGLVVLGEDGCAQTISQAAARLLGPQNGLEIMRDGQLRGTPAAADAELRRALQAAAVPAQALQPHRGSVQTQGSAGGLHVEVVALPNAEGAAPRRVALMLSQRGAGVANLQQALQALYRMTPSEAALTSALAGGATLVQVAEQRAVSIHTVRTQLRSAAAKAGAKRQADLVRIVLTGPAARRAPADG